MYNISDVEKYEIEKIPYALYNEDILHNVGNFVTGFNVQIRGYAYMKENKKQPIAIIIQSTTDIRLNDKETLMSLKNLITGKIGSIISEFSIDLMRNEIRIIYYKQTNDDSINVWELEFNDYQEITVCDKKNKRSLSYFNRHEENKEEL